MIYRTIDIDGAKLVTYVLSNYECLDINRKRPMIIICPGGGYRHCSDREAEAVAIRFNSLGYNCCVLFYSVYDESSEETLYPKPQVELAGAINYVIDNADSLNTDSSKIILMGFSAGGHLAASVGLEWQKFGAVFAPAAMVLCYPVITASNYAEKHSINSLVGYDFYLIKEVSLENKVSRDCPPTFIWTTREDSTVPFQNSVMFAESLKREHVKHKLVVFEHGVHGLSLGTEEVSAGRRHETKEIQRWPEMADKFLTKVLGPKFIPADQL